MIDASPASGPSQSPVHKRCSRCSEWKLLSEFHRDRKAKDGLNTRCKVCNNQASHLQWLHNREKLCQQKRDWNARNSERLKPYKKEHYLANREAIRARERARYARDYPINPQKYLSNVHKRRARSLENGGSYTAEEWQALCARYGNKCLLCDRITTLTVDHVVPISWGGSNDISNLQPLCSRCNAEKGDRHMEFRRFHEPIEIE